MSGATRAEVCVVACAEAWRGDGEILASPIGLIPMIGARLARATFEPDLLLTDGEAYLTRGTWAIGDKPPVVEGWMPFRFAFDVLWSGRRHVMMGPSQIDRYGNANISAIGDFHKPKVQLLGVRGAPGNTVNHPTSYWVPRHAPRSFVDTVDMVSGIGYDRAAAAGPEASRYHHLRRVVSNLGVFDFDTPDHRMRLASRHPGVTVEEIQAATAFELAVADDVPETRQPTEEELDLIRRVIDPTDKRSGEVA
ncbi:CoA-transferase [Virgisporangium ochraceum]|uniref:CoA-transferase n=1 Tax=Virgisporangium ochraceum TaxID=65505 RepID=A0A8J4E952_9ACTN|nr:CoA-transferase [Virgisporangium ochraceum]GIJ66850.1 CoA-transferase [Virgisporangium ochraceum]